MTDLRAFAAAAAATPDRRTVLKGAALGAAATAVLPARFLDTAAAEAPAAEGVFGYGVASGDPTGSAVVIWTRATPPGTPVATPGSGLGQPLQVRWEVARGPKFETVEQSGVVLTSPDSDHTVKVDVRGLSPYTRYWYRFTAAGQTSPVGRTQTAPDEHGVQHALRFALVSCSNYTGGFFTAYRAIAKRDDLDLVLHVGDYIYEYGNGADRYGPDGLVGKRDNRPPTEIITLRDYRLRHALYKAEPDLQRAHGRHPWITTFDDHEVANNTWAFGAQNHTQNEEGAFLQRRREAYQAYLEWMPFRLPDQSQDVPHTGTRFFKRFHFGSLAQMYVLDTRQNRDRQVEAADGSTKGGGFIGIDDPAIEAQIADPSRHLPDPGQLTWLKDGLSLRSRWHLVGNQTVMAPVVLPGALLGVDAKRALNSDQWDGYRADQSDLLQHMGTRPAVAGDTVVLTGDIHSSWANDLPYAQEPDGSYRSAGVEFVCPSVTSDGFYEVLGGGTADTAEQAVGTVRFVTSGVQGNLPWVKYLNGLGHGFTLVDVAPDRVQADFFLTPVPSRDLPDPRLVKSIEPTYAASWRTRAGRRRLEAAPEPIGPRSDSPR